jgi:hypothetical protein
MADIEYAVGECETEKLTGKLTVEINFTNGVIPSVNILKQRRTGRDNEGVSTFHVTKRQINGFKK